MSRRAPRIAFVTAVAVLALAGLAVAGVRTGVLPSPLASPAAKAKKAKPIRVRLSPAVVRLVPGRELRIRVTIDGRRWPNTGGARARSSARLRAKVRLSVARPLPRGVTVRLTPKVTATRRAVLYVRTSTKAAPGIHKLRIVATRVRPRGAKRLRAVGTLRAVLPRAAAPRTVAPAPTTTPAPAPAPTGDGPRLLVGGNLRVALGPGITEPVDVKLGNPFGEPLDVTGIGLEITDINAPNSSTALPCDLRDFQVAPSSGAPVRLPPMSVRSLEEIGIPRPQWPSIAMLNRPVNQNGCKGAAVTFRYRAEARSLDP
ncbi:MAG: hypothetical protein MUC84_10090 [Solirubrobacteraceae bacterium]|jgi:hypothetical protein|nr:hypothetical protein [Solirubrobacteraceae bacterium]